MAPSGALGPARGPVGCPARCTAVSRSRSPRARRQSPGGMKRGTEARSPRLPTRRLPRLSARAPPLGCQHLAARRGGREEERGRGREEGAADRQLLPAARSRARFAPLGWNQEALPFRSPTPPPAPLTAQPRRPAPRAHALGWIPASLSRWGRAGSLGSFKIQSRPSEAQAQPWGSAAGAPRRTQGAPHPARNSCVGKGAGAGAQDPPELLQRSRPSRVRSETAPPPARSIPHATP